MQKGSNLTETLCFFTERAQFIAKKIPIYRQNSSNKPIYIKKTLNLLHKI